MQAHSLAHRFAVKGAWFILRPPCPIIPFRWQYLSKYATTHATGGVGPSCCLTMSAAWPASAIWMATRGLQPSAAIFANRGEMPSLFVVGR